MDEIDDVIKSKPEHLVIHVGRNDLANGINLLNNVKKIVKRISKKLPKICTAFSSIIKRENGKILTKKLTVTNQKLHVNRKGNSSFAKNLLKYLNNI